MNNDEINEIVEVLNIKNNFNEDIVKVVDEMLDNLLKLNDEYINCLSKDNIEQIENYIKEIKKDDIDLSNLKIDDNKIKFIKEKYENIKDIEEDVEEKNRQILENFLKKNNFEIKNFDTLLQNFLENYEKEKYKNNVKFSEVENDNNKIIDKIKFVYKHDENMPSVNEENEIHKMMKNYYNNLEYNDTIDSIYSEICGKIIGDNYYYISSGHNYLFYYFKKEEKTIQPRVKGNQPPANEEQNKKEKITLYYYINNNVYMLHISVAGVIIIRNDKVEDIKYIDYIQKINKLIDIIGIPVMLMKNNTLIKQIYKNIIVVNYDNFKNIFSNDEHIYNVFIHFNQQLHIISQLLYILQNIKSGEIEINEQEVEFIKMINNLDIDNLLKKVDDKINEIKKELNDKNIPLYVHYLKFIEKFGNTNEQCEYMKSDMCSNMYKKNISIFQNYEINGYNKQNNYCSDEDIYVINYNIVGNSQFGKKLKKGTRNKLKSKKNKIKKSRKRKTFV